MSKPVNKKFRNALLEAINATGSQKELAAKAKIPESNIGKYLAGKIRNIHDRTYQKLLPFLNIESDDNQEAESSAGELIKDRQTKTLIEIFQQLNRKNKRQVIAEAEDYLCFQGKDDYISEFTAEELEQLADKGITCRYGYEFTFTTKALCWIYNVMNLSKSYGEELTNELFKKLLKEKIPEGYCRELRIKIFEVDVYHGNTYEQLTFYLNGSPPKCYAPYLLINKVCKVYTIERNKNAPFRLPDESIFDLEFSDEEYEALKSGQTLKITYSD